MRDPERKRNVALALFLAGPVVGFAAFALPAGSLPDGLRGPLFAIALMLVLFAGTAALVLHQSVKARRRLARSENVLARWRIPAQDWRAFLVLDAERNARGDRERNEFAPTDDATPREVEVVVGKEAVEIDGSLHALPRHGMPLVTRAEFDESRVRGSVIEFDLNYPGDGFSEAGSAQGPRFTLLRFPVPQGAKQQALAVIAHYRQETPGEPSFFHGPGDGSDAEDLTVCWNCGFQTYRLVAGCERCGASMVSRRWARRYGAILVVLGLLLGAGGTLLLSQLPVLLHPGYEMGGTRFTGGPGMAKLVILILGGVAVFGFTTLGYGIFQVATGRRSWPVVRAMLAIVAGLYVVGLAIRGNWL